MKIKSISNIMIGTLVTTSYLFVYNFDTIIEGLQDPNKKVIVEEVEVNKNELNYVEQMEKEHEIKYKETIKNEIVNSDFESKFNEIKSIYNEYLDSIHLGDTYDGGRLLRTNQSNVNEFLKEEYIEKLKNIETDSESILHEYKYSLILDMMGSTSSSKDMLENIIKEELSNNK